MRESHYNETRYDKFTHFKDIATFAYRPSRIKGQQVVKLPQKTLDQMQKTAPGGYYLALRVGFAFPIVEVNAFPAEWVEHYSQQGMMLRDPAVRWAYTAFGAKRWSAFEDSENGVLASASKFGLRFGAVISCGQDDGTSQRSYALVAHPKREFGDAELASIFDRVTDMHARTSPPPLTAAELEALRMINEGYRVKEISHRLGVSDSAIKVRMASAKRKLGARTSTQAAGLAVSYRMI